MGVPEAVGRDKPLPGKPDRKGVSESPRQQPLEGRRREAGKDSLVAQEKHASKWEVTSKGHRDATGMRTAVSLGGGRWQEEGQREAA